MQLTPDVEFIISRLSACGHRADIVGGPVRDFLRGVTPDDYDITTDATPDETKAAFREFRTVDTGIKHGTVTLVLNSRPYEITTYRIDGEYKDSRHPESVSFTKKIEEDLSRRDFTMNAIAFNPSCGITDPFRGREDIEKRIIRAVGDAELRFTEDALRILRCVRFASTLGFSVEEETKKALFTKMRLLSNVSAERIYTEFRKMLAGGDAYSVLSEYAPIFEYIIPTLRPLTLPERANFESADLTSRQLSLFAAAKSPTKAFETAAKALKTDSRIKELGTKVLASIGKYAADGDASILRMLSELGEEAAFALLRLEILLGEAEVSALCRAERLVKDGATYKLSQLAVNGSDVMRLGASGKQVGEILAELLSAVIDGTLENGRTALLSRAAELIEKRITKTV